MSSKLTKVESKAVSDVVKLAKRLAAAACPISGWGDGNCGYVIEQVINALEGEGLFTGKTGGKK